MAMPDGIKIGVIYGPSGSGKSRLLAALSTTKPVSEDTIAEQFKDDMAVCSHPAFGDGEDAISLLSAAGLNKIPAWVRPLHSISNGERSRALLAVALASASKALSIDDFASNTDAASAMSTARSLASLVRRRGLQSVWIATANRQVLRCLEADVVVFAESRQVVPNPWPRGERRADVEWQWHVKGFREREGQPRTTAAWVGDEFSGRLKDDREQVAKEAAEAAGRTLRWSTAGSERTLCAEVQITDACRKVEEAFEYSFDGTSTTTLHAIRDLGALVGPTSLKSRIIVLTGPSGSGKTSELRRLVDALGLHANLDALSWYDSSPVKEQLGGSASEAAALLRAVALPEQCWLRPYSHLSSGEQSRADIARRLSLGEGAIDEFTSCLDRATARRVCSGVAKFVRAKDMTLCVSTIWQDIIPALLPDSVYWADTGKVCQFVGVTPTADTYAAVKPAQRQLKPCNSLADGTDPEEVKVLLRPTPLRVSVWPLDLEKGRDWWQTTFHQHHYLTGGLHNAARAVLVREMETQTPIAFHSIILMCGGFNGGISYLEHRLVVLPDYQGWGLGPALSENMGSLLLRAGRRFFATTSHPRLRDSRQKRKDQWGESADSGSLTKPSTWKTPKVAPTVLVLTADELAEGAAEGCRGCNHRMNRRPGRPPACTCSRQARATAEPSAQAEPSARAEPSTKAAVGDGGKRRRVWRFQFLGGGNGNNHLTAHLRKSKAAEVAEGAEATEAEGIHEAAEPAAGSQGEGAEGAGDSDDASAGDAALEGGEEMALDEAPKTGRSGKTANAKASEKRRRKRLRMERRLAKGLEVDLEEAESASDPGGGAVELAVAAPADLAAGSQEAGVATPSKRPLEDEETRQQGSGDKHSPSKKASSMVLMERNAGLLMERFMVLMERKPPEIQD